MKKGFKIFQILLMILSIISLAFACYWFGYVVYYLNDPSYGEELGTGLGIAFGIIFQLMASGISLVISLTGLVVSIIGYKREKQKRFLIFNIIFITINILLGIVLLIIT